MNDPARISRSGGQGADARTALALLAVVVVFITLYPFGFVRTGEVYAQQLRQSLRDPLDLYLPLHALPAMLGVWLLWASRAWRSRWRPAVAVCAALIVLELVQAGIVRRHARAGDLVVQWIGAGLGIWTLPIASRIGAALLRVRRVLWAVLLVAWTGLACVVVIRGQAGHTISRWDETFPFVLGDEYGGNRGWSGVIHSAGVLAGAIDHAKAQEMFASPVTSPSGLEVRRGLAPSIIYDLTGGARSLGTIAPELRTKGVTFSERGLELGDGSRIQSQKAVPEMTRAIVRAGGATVEVECTPTLTHQSGPARVLTISKGLDYRNLTLGQEGDAAVLRVRTPRSGRNGADFPVSWPGVFEAGSRVHLIATTTGGRARLWVNGVDRGERESISQLGDWLKVRSAGRSWIAGAVLLLPIGLICSRLGRSARSRGVLSGLAGGIVVASALGYAQWEGRTLPMNVAWVGGWCIALGLVLGWWIGPGEPAGERTE